MPRSEGFLRLFRHRSGIRSGRLEHSVTLNRICASPVGEGIARCRLRHAEHRRDAGLAEIGVVGLALQAALGLLLELEFAGDRVERRAVLQPFFEFVGLGGQAAWSSPPPSSRRRLSARTSSSVRSRAGVIDSQPRRKRSRCRPCEGWFSVLGFGLEHRLDQIRRFRQVLDDRAVRPQAVRSIASMVTTFSFSLAAASRSELPAARASS